MPSRPDIDLATNRSCQNIPARKTHPKKPTRFQTSRSATESKREHDAEPPTTRHHEHVAVAISKIQLEFPGSLVHQLLECRRIDLLGILLGCWRQILMKPELLQPPEEAGTVNAQLACRFRFVPFGLLEGSFD